MSCEGCEPKAMHPWAKGCVRNQAVQQAQKGKVAWLKADLQRQPAVLSMQHGWLNRERMTTLHRGAPPL